MMKYWIQIILLTFASQLCGQASQNAYRSFSKKADSLYQNKDYKSSGLMYSKAFASFGGRGAVKDRFSAACSWARAGYADSAFFQLEKIASKGFYYDHERLTNEKDLMLLHDKPRWKPLLEKMKHNQDSMEVGQNKNLIAKLDSLEKEDQKWRNHLTDLHNNELNKDSIDPKTILPNMIAADKRHTLEVRKIFYQYGFPNYDLVGTRGSTNFWLLVQHQSNNLELQDSVLKAMKIEVDKGKASPSNYAYLVDRVKLHKGENQIYGTQLELNSDGTSYAPRSVFEPEKLNERRGSVGLSTIEEYIEQVNSRHFGDLKKK